MTNFPSVDQVDKSDKSAKHSNGAAVAVAFTVAYKRSKTHWAESSDCHSHVTWEVDLPKPAILCRSINIEESKN